MTTLMERLERGGRCWPAEIGLRSAGLALFGWCAVLWRTLCRLADKSSPHEFVLAAIFCVCLSSGLALSIEGAGLFKLVPLPPRALI